MSKLLILSFSILMTFQLIAQETKSNKKLIAPKAEVQKVKGGYAFTEGPSVAPDGRVFFTDQPNDKIDVWSEDGTITTYL